MNPPRATGAAPDETSAAATADATDQAAREVWARMCDLVLDNVRRREVSETIGMSFGRIKAVRRVAARSMSMRELADELTIDPPNATVIVDELEALGLVRRQSHPTDRRAKVVEATRKGKEIAKRANAILSTPPHVLRTLSPDDLGELERILDQLDTAAERD
jgi:DNA-binding MarR family transcriptional regulator